MQINQHSTLLIDSNAYMYRFYFGSEPRQDHAGNSVHVIYSFMSFARRLLQQYKPERMVFVFDAEGENFRHELYNEYKSHRDPMPEELASQITHIQRALKLLGIPVLEQPQVEADDAIASLANVISARDEQVYIFSLDKDLMQLVNPNVAMVDDRRGNLMDENYVRKKFGIEPERVVEMLALTGDDADNIPGVEGVGQVTAAKLINQWGDIDNILANSHWVKGVIGNNLRKGEERLRLSLKLTQLKIDLYDESIMKQLKLYPEDKVSIHHFCNDMGFQV
ncbi:MAG: hypothetical protein HKP09_05880 [Enterobacterales bacterium]|nr:hypothetical protein [Enterobacterales bacterium]